MDTPEIFEIPSAPFTFNGKTVQLHGLSLGHIIHIVREHTEALSNLYMKAAEGRLQSNPQTVAIELADEFAPIVGRVIACGLGQPDAAAQMSRLPFPAQIEAMTLIFSLTTTQIGGLEKTLEIVTQALMGANAALFQKP